MEPNGDDLDLDDMLADMAAPSTPAERAAVRRQAQSLLDAVQHGATADRGSALEGAGPVVVVEHDTFDGTLFLTFDPLKLQTRVVDTTDGGITQLVIASGGLGMTTTTLGAGVAKIKERYLVISGGTAVLDPHEPHSAIISTLLAAKPALTTLCGLVGVPDLDLPLPHAAAVMAFFETYPRFWGVLTGRCRIEFKSSRADGRGGGLYEAGTIYMSSMIATPPGVFIRLLVHETGHATFESILLADRPMPIELTKGEVSGLPAKYDPLPPGQAEHLVLAQHSRNIQHIHDYWNLMSLHAKAFYHAWLTLRQHRNRLLGLELWRDPKGNRLDDDQRQKYQAGSFSEFCAEVFMQYAIGDLHPYIVALLLDANVEPEVKVAWRNAWHVLEQVAAPILGPRAG